MDDDLEKRIKALQEKAAEQNKRLHSFTTPSGYEASVSISDDEHTLVLNDKGYLATYSVTPDGFKLENLEDPKGKVILNDLERIKLYNLEVHDDAVLDQLFGKPDQEA